MSELIHSFGIDWRLLLAQAANFFILLFLLNRFAYGPIKSMLKKRKEEIEKGLLYTKRAREDLEKVDEVKEQTIKKTRQEALGIVSAAENLGKKRKEEMLIEANRKVEILVTDAKRFIQEERAKMSEEVYKDAKGIIRLGVEKVIGGLPDEEKGSFLIEEALSAMKKS